MTDMTQKHHLPTRKLRFRKLKKAPPGSAPGLITAPEGSSKPEARLFSYDETSLSEHTFHVASDIKSRIDSQPALTHWVEIRGLGDKNFFEELSSLFNIHRLEIEDVLSGHQRPKMEEYEGHLFITGRLITLSKEEDWKDDQVAFLIFTNTVIVIHDSGEEIFSTLRERLHHNRGILRTSGASYLGYALMDALVDHYFPFLERMGNFLDDLEDSLLTSPDRYSLQNIQTTKRRLILFRRVAWGEREKLNDILRTPTPLFSEMARRYLRDTYDHTIQIMDIIDSYREITASLMDIYLSSVSNRLNQVMKFLTVISTIFIPLTFIVGVYGMNFVFYDEKSGTSLPLNMPELHHPYGYIGVWGVMLMIVVGMIYYFYRKGWLGER